MLCEIDGATTRPKSIEDIDNAIFNNGIAPDEVIAFRYRKIFGLTAQEYEDEPIDQLYTNLYIYGQMNKKEELEAKHG